MGIFTIMVPEYIKTLLEISSWHVLPHLPQVAAFDQVLKRVVGDLPYHRDNRGNYIVGAGSPAAVPRSGLCLRAGMPGCGGILRQGEGNKYLFSSVSGYQLPNRLLGRKFGVYSVSGLKICELEVEWVDMGAEEPVLYFLPGERERKEIIRAGTTMICHPAAFTLHDEQISACNLAACINSALVIHILRTKGHSDGLCACLSRQKLRQRGADEGVDNLFSINFDSFAYGNDTQDFGYRPIAAGASTALEQDPKKLWPRTKDKQIWAYLGIENAANATSVGRFEPEIVPASRLEKYLEFAGALVEVLQSRKIGPLSVMNEAIGIASALETSGDFAVFLNSGMLMITKIFRRYGLLFAAAKSSSYDTLRKRLADRSINLGPDDGKLAGWARECIEEVHKVIPLASKRHTVTVITILMSPVPVVSSNCGGIQIFLSLDKIDAAELKKTLFAELVYRLTEELLADLGLPSRVVAFYSHGLRYALTARLLGISIEESLGFSKHKVESLRVNSAELKRDIKLFLGGEMCSLYEGRHHKFFRRRELCDPYKPGTEAFSGFGSFLAAEEVFSLLEKGAFNEKIHSF